MKLNNNSLKFMPVIFAFFGLGCIWALNFWSEPIDGDSFMGVCLAGITLLVIAAATARPLASKFLFAVSALVISLGLLLAPAFNSFHPALLISSAFALFGAIYAAWSIVAPSKE